MSIDKHGLDLKHVCSGKRKVFLETGTGYGDGVQSAIDSGLFERYISIELNPELVTKCRERFKDNGQVMILEGSSRDLLPDVLSSLEDDSFLLLLDAHFSGGEHIGEKMDTYLFSELECLEAFSSQLKSNIILVDDVQFLEQHSLAFDENRIPAGSTAFIDPVSDWCKRAKDNLFRLTSNPVGYYRGTVRDEGTPIGPLFFISIPHESIP